MYGETQLHRPIRLQPEPPRVKRPQPQRQNVPVQPSAPARTQPRQRWLPFMALGGVAIGGMALLSCVATLLLVVALSANRIPEGVTVAGIDLSGQKIEEAQAALQQAFSADTVTLMDGERSQIMPLSDLGISVDAATTVEQAQEARANSAITPVYTVDLVQTQAALIGLSDVFDVEPVFEPRQMGRAIEIPVLLDRLRADTAGELADGIIDLPMVEVAPPEADELTLANYNGATVTHVVEPGQELGLIAKQYNVPVESIVSMNDIANPDVLWVGQSLTIPSGGEYAPTAADAPAPSTNAGKAIVVSVGTQRIYAYENGALVHSHLVSTGLPETPTVLGDYNIYVKYTADDMSGPDYFLPQVPYTMYFYQGYAIHGTYWHTKFGRPMSHGCVNLPVSESQWFFNWAQVGTPVRIVA